MKENELIIRKSKKEDIEEILSIIKDAKKSLKAMRVDQWQDGYPNKNDINSDIEKSVSYVVIFEQRVVAYFVLTTAHEDAYDYITKGDWLMNAPIYGVLHRLCVAKNITRKGLGLYIVTFCKKKLKEDGIKSLRVDTHKENVPMLSLIEKSGFVYCGEVLMHAAPRNAYEVIL